MPKSRPLSVDLPRIDAGTQSRIAINEDVVQDYADLIAASNGEWPFPPLDVFHDGWDHYVADGFHRILAARRTNRGSIPCIVHKGTAEDARIFGMTANDRHGLRMTRADKRACVEWFLDNRGKMTQAAIAEKAGVSARLVQTIVAERKPKFVPKQPPPVATNWQSANSLPRLEGQPIVGGDPSEAPESPEPPEARQEAARDAQCPNCGGTDFDEDGDCAKCHEPWVTKPPKKTKPPKQYPKAHWFKQYDQAIGPVCRLVDKIASEVGGKKNQAAVQDHLNDATEEMMLWMGVEKK